MGILAFIRAVFEFLGLVGREIHDAEQRKAGSDASQVEAQNEENKRIVAAAAFQVLHIIESKVAG